MADKRNATSSWSGYNHQGKVGIFLALEELSTLIIKGNNNVSDYTLEFESDEDVDIRNSKSVISRHQVKAKTKGEYPNDYDNVRKINSPDCPSGYDTNGTKCNNRFLHVICEVKGWDLDEKEFKEKFPNAKYVKNESEVRLYEYPDKKEYCNLINCQKSPIDDFCKDKIKEILNLLKNKLGEDDIYIEETLFEIKDLICKRISEAHNAGKKFHPIIQFEDIYEIIVSGEKREKQSMHRARKQLEIYWNKNFDGEISAGLFNNILNLSDNDFKQFIIDLHPQRSIKSMDENKLIDGLIDEDIFEEIFYEFYKRINQEHFDLKDIKYTSKQFTYRLSLINKKYKLGEVSEIIQNIRNNREFLKASFDVDYLVNGRINCPIPEKRETDEFMKSLYTSQPSKKDVIFANNLEFIDIDKTIEKLDGERYE